MLRPLRDHVLSGLQQWQLISCSASCLCASTLLRTPDRSSLRLCRSWIRDHHKLIQNYDRVALVPERRKTHQPHTCLLSSARSKCKTEQPPYSLTHLSHTKYRYSIQTFPPGSLPIASIAAFCFRTTSSVYMASTFQCQSVFVIRGILNHKSPVGSIYENRYSFSSLLCFRRRFGIV